MASGKKKKLIINSDPDIQLPGRKHRRWFIFSLIVSILFAYIPVFQADFVNWDDDDYVLNNQSITSISNFQEIVSNPVQGNYHPITMLSLASNYAISGKDATSYHIVNLLLHIINTLLVFIFVLALNKQKLWMAFIVALLFGIHPLHVESVAWVSERKDLLYSMFFISGMIVYSRYLEQRNFILLGGVFVFFVLSLLSKPAAVIFPVVLLSIDFYKGTLNKVRTYFEKIPFLAMSVLMGLLTLQGQSNEGATVFAQIFSFSDRFLFACYGVMMYLVKTIYPVGLCAFYPFPEFSQGIPSAYYIAPIVVVLLVLIFLRSLRTNKLFSFAILFYLVNLSLVLQLIPVGNAVIADRYAYLPLMGIFLIPGFYYQKWIEGRNGKLSSPALITLVIVSLFLMRMTYTQASTWKNGERLWDQALKVSPSSRAYVNRALLYKKAGNINKAFECYNKAISLGTKEPDAWVNRGNIYFSNKEYERAIEDYSQCLALSSINIKAYENRGAAYASIGKPELALLDWNMALKLDANSAATYANRAMLMISTNKYEDALLDFNRYLSLTSDPNGEIWSFSGEANFKLGNYTEALNCYNQALSIRETGIYYLNRSMILFQLDRKQEAYEDALKAVQLGAKIDPAYLRSLEAK